MSSRFLSQQTPVMYVNAIDFSSESNSSGRICHLLAVPLGHVADRSHFILLKFTLPILKC